MQIRYANEKTFAAPQPGLNYYLSEARREIPFKRLDPSPTLIIIIKMAQEQKLFKNEV